ncbi:hypothetical protein [Halarcobacter ebronensis]|uniref:RlfB protein n=1 Tax=Halarcobacter ebronensis TaxID=1462615 RepID=A0A4Q1ALC3_9BACT|nr:hypothetical protein [Halarcobacter ebronensis]QKF83360.1 hypothetical protein AEBR_2909 [Halarcobacter ebronensis]RXK05921.1 hypothetical protein CRV07_07560 [Halarcobacter ebronensis]
MTSLIVQYDSSKTVRENLEILYKYFENDFITNTTVLNNQYNIDIDMNSMKKSKPKIFWHVITREKEVRVPRGRTWQTKKIRKFDKNRAKRIRWIKYLIQNFNKIEKNIFAFFYRETEGQNRGKLRLYIWAKSHDYVVIIEKLNRNSSFLVTAFYIDDNYNKSTYQDRYEKSGDLNLGLSTWI